MTNVCSGVIFHCIFIISLQMTPNEQPPVSGITITDFSEERADLQKKLDEMTEPMTQLQYLSVLLKALRCRLITEDAYDQFAHLGLMTGIPYSAMAINLRTFLLEELGKRNDDAASVGNAVAHKVQSALN